MVVVVAVEDAAEGERLVEEGAFLAPQLGEELHVLHVVEYEELVESLDDDTAPDRRTVRQQATDHARGIASSITDQFTPVGRVGKPASEIVSYLEEVDATYVVIGGKHRSPVGKAVFGSVTQKVIMRAPCPVVTIIDEE